MPVSYPLALPVTPSFSQCAFKYWNIVAATHGPFSGERQIVEHIGEGWKVECSLPVMLRVQAGPWLAFLASLRGPLGTFHVGPSYAKIPRGVALPGVGVTPQVGGDHAAHSKTLSMTGWKVSTDGILLAGDFIEVGTGATKRLHMILGDINTDGSGSCTADIFPQLREALTSGAGIVYLNCQGTFALSGEALNDCTEGKLFHIAFPAIEAL